MITTHMIVMNPQYWPYSWQRLFERIEMHELVNTYEQRYIAFPMAGGRMEFKSMEEMDTYCRTVHRLDVANGEEFRAVNGGIDYDRWVVNIRLV